MRAILLCLLHAAFCVSQYSWDSNFPTETQPNVCLKDQATCGCCLMQRHMQRMEYFFNVSYEEMSRILTQSKMALNNMRASRSAFSVALNHTIHASCFGPFDNDEIIIYQHVFINLGGGYSATTGIFTAPLSGVYSLAVTIYSADPTGHVTGPCADLLVNGQVVASLTEHKDQDPEDSATAVLSVKLKAGDTVEVILPKGCVICADRSHFNTFTGYLLYPCE